MSVLVDLPDIPGLRRYSRGKVRETFDLGDRLLMVATDRISAYDSILPTGIPNKGIVLTQLSKFWFERIGDIVPNHMLTTDLSSLPEAARAMESTLEGRSMIVRRAERIDIECVARGYLSGSAWAEYRENGSVVGIKLPSGLTESAKLPEPIFTPATKSSSGHDINVSFEYVANQVGEDLATRLRDITLRVYQAAESYAAGRGIIIADTKFEFGFISGELTLIDEALTPDSSRFWDAELYSPGKAQPSFDKQFVRDWLTSSGWDREPPAPALPDDVARATSEKYMSAYERLSGRPLFPLA
ncbi:MAG TPA: phosphoribosylaminoimidazolesuccinocarboxamide synthase [Nitrolancea sp.]|nr:phosphoribosylaminoimidazolesuccinocarboxamide synthase [Nitrolancea sp.]